MNKAQELNALRLIKIYGVKSSCSPATINIENIVNVVYSQYAANKSVNLDSLLHEMRVKGTYQESLELYIRSIISTARPTADVLLCCATVKGYSILRHMEQIEELVCHLVMEEPAEADEMLRLVDQVCRTVLEYKPNDGFLPVKNLIGDVYQEIESIGEDKEPDQGVATGYRDIDNYTRGLLPKEITLVVARPAMGKTSFGLNVALNVARNTGKTIAVFSAESTRKQIIHRLLSMESLVDSMRLFNAQLTEEEWRRVAFAASTLSNMDIRINDDISLSVEEITSQCCVMENLGLVVIDYLQLMAEASYGELKGRERASKISKISKRIKNMAEILNVPVIVLSQTGRKNESRNDKRPWLSDLNIYGSAIEDADVIIGLYRETYYNINYENRNEAEAIILKNTHGRCGTVYLNWEPNYLSFTDKE